MASKRVGVDIGATAVRVAQIDGLDGDSLARITRAAVVPLAPGSVVAGRIRDPRAVGFTMAQALKQAGVNGYGIIVGVSSPESAIAPVKLPLAVKTGEWSNSLRLQGRPVSPRVELRDSALSLYEVAEDPASQARFLLASATSQAEVNAVAAAVREAKASPRAVDLAGAATMRALARALPGNNDVVTVVDIGASKITVVTRQGMFLRSVRTVEAGGEDVTRAIMGATGESFDLAEHRKRSMRLLYGSRMRTPGLPETVSSVYGGVVETSVSDMGTSGDQVGEALRFAAEQLLEDIATIIESETVLFPDSPTQGIVLTGGGSLLQGLKEALAERVGVPTLLGRPWSTFASTKAAKNVLSSMDEPSAMIELATAVGLAMWGTK